MPGRMKILCVHGVGDHHTSLDWENDWREAVVAALGGWSQNTDTVFDYLLYDEIFERYPLDAKTCTEALMKMGISGIEVGIGNVVDRIGQGLHGLFHPARAFDEIPAQLRWTAGMVAQWADIEALRKVTREALTAKIEEFEPDLVLAHSLGTLISFDTFARDQSLIDGRTLVTFGSQIANPFVRGTFGGYLTPLTKAKHWYQLYNPNDRVFTSEIRVSETNFTEVFTVFKDGSVNHDAVHYLSHPNAEDAMWQQIALPPSKSFAGIARSLQPPAKQERKPDRRALLVGINDYPDPRNRLEGCINDVFLMSATLQESGFAPEEIRVVFDDRATTQGILERLQWLLDDTRVGDERVFFYSGHGAQIPAYGMYDEVDHVLECLVPWDFDWTPERAITDKQLLQLYSQLPHGVNFMMVLDCCHSGGMSRDGMARVRGIEPPDDIRHRALQWNWRAEMWEERKLPSPNKKFSASEEARQAYLGRSGASYRLGRAIPLRRFDERQQKRIEKEMNHGGPFMPVIFEACQEEQLSYEYRHGVTSYGAFTFAMTKILSSARRGGQKISFTDLRERTERRLRDLGYDQTPCLVGPKSVIKKALPWRPSQPIEAKTG